MEMGSLNTRQVRTIVVDDESRIRRGIERLVKSASEEFEIVGSFSSGVELLDHYQHEKIEFDLLITDIKMPGMDGLELIKELKKHESFEAVVISGFSDFKYLQTAIREGAVDYMVKPIIRDEFRSQLNIIKKKIMTKWRTKDKLEEIDSQLNYIKQIQNLSELSNRKDIDLSELEWTKDFPPGNYCLLCISVDHTFMKKQSPIPTNWHAKLEECILAVMGNFYNGGLPLYWYWKGEDSSLWLLIHVKDEEEIKEMPFAEQLHASLKYNFQIANSIVISRQFHDVALLPNISDELFSLLQFRLIYGGNQIYSFESMANHLNEWGKVRETKELDTIINRIMTSIESMDQKNTNYLLQQFLTGLEKLTHPIDIERNIQSLSIQTVNLLLKHAHAKDEIMIIQEALSFVKKAPNFTVLKTNMNEWMNKVFLILEKINQRDVVDPVEAAKKWIMNNLGENITIDKIAREIHMNSTYFCEYFKNQTGETILDYVTKVRIEKARELLLATDFRIYDIAQTVGYSDTKYFSKLFKKHFGEVPSKYRYAGQNIM